MKICFYINSITSGGAERVMVNLASEMAERGHICTLITTFRASWEYKLGVHVNRVSLFQTRPKNFFIRNIGTLLKLHTFLKTDCPDLLVTFMGEPNFRGILATRGLPVKSVISVRNTPESEYGSTLGKFFAKKLFRLASFVVFQTQEAQEWFPREIQARSAIIFNPVNSIFYETRRSEVPQGIITVGRLVEQKNHKLLIRAYAQIANKVSDDLTIYGNGDAKPLEKFANSLGVGRRIHFPGQSSNIPHVLSRARLFVLSSNFEGMPNALMEAMAVGVPCVSTDCPCGGPKMLFSERIGQFLVPVGNDNALAEKMLQVLSNSEVEKLLADECKKASSVFESSRIFDEWEQCLFKCTTESRK